MSKIKENQFTTEIVNLDEMIPEDHFLRVIKKHFDWNFVYEEVETDEVIGEKEIIVSDVDKDAGMLYKSDKEKMFGYNTSVICENNNYVLTVDTNGSNIHDSVSFYQSFERLTNNFDINLVNYFVGDAAYLTLFHIFLYNQYFLLPLL